jgi:hypothetical protein
MEVRVEEPQVGAANEQCCTLPPFKSDYVPTGKTIQLQSDVSGQNLDVYLTGPEAATTALVAIYGKTDRP